jgi:hypothetical protein
MFTQSDLHGVDRPLRAVEEVGYPVGVIALAAGRLFAFPAVGRAGGVLVVAGLLAFGVVLARRLREARVEWTPMLSRYAVVAVAMVAWAVLALPAWLADPLAPGALFGGRALVHLLVFGVVGFVVVGTLYHVVPFVVWVHRYSDDLGLRDVPMVDDLYDDRLAAVDFVAVLGGCVALVAGARFSLPRTVTVAGGALAVAGFAVFAANLSLVIRRHSPHSLGDLLVPPVAARWRGRTDAGDDRVEPRGDARE